jgi:hypothetical protein
VVRLLSRISAVHHANDFHVIRLDMDSRLFLRFSYCGCHDLFIAV